MSPAHIGSLPPMGEGLAFPSGNYAPPPPFSHPWAGVTSHLPRQAGKNGRGCCQYPALARAALRETKP